jgi:hypothetical protein
MPTAGVPDLPSRSAARTAGGAARTTANPCRWMACKVALTAATFTRSAAERANLQFMPLIRAADEFDGGT